MQTFAPVEYNGENQKYLRQKVYPLERKIWSGLGYFGVFLGNKERDGEYIEISITPEMT